VHGEPSHWLHDFFHSKTVGHHKKGTKGTIRNKRMHHTQPFKLSKCTPSWFTAKGVSQINFGEAQSMGFNWPIKTMTQKCYILVKNGLRCYWEYVGNTLGTCKNPSENWMRIHWEQQKSKINSTSPKEKNLVPWMQLPHLIGWVPRISIPYFNIFGVG
jgi:hypothetical protein